MDGNMKRAKLRLAPLTLIQQQQPGVQSPLKPKSIEIKSAPPQLSFRIENKFTSHLAINRKRFFLILLLALLTLSFLMYLQLSKEIRKLYFSPLNRYDLPPLRQLTPTLQHFLKDKNIHRLLNVRCGMQCLLNQRDDILKQAGIQVFYENVVEEVHLDGDSQFYDWINVHSYGSFDPQQIRRLAQSSKIGVAIIWQQQSYYSQSHQNLKQTYQLFKQNGLYYNTIQSLNLRRMQPQIIQIFTRVQKNSQVIRGIENNYNYIAIHTTINLYKDIPFLRQWIVYHLTIGVDKIFIYDTFDTRDLQQLDIGDDRCDGVQTYAVYEEFQKIWDDFYFSIVYVPWKVGKQKFGWPFEWIQPDPQHDYIYNFKLATKYTIFLKPHQMLFSKFGVKISDPLQSNRSCYTINRKQFLDRTCTGHQHMLQNYQYLPVLSPQSAIFQTENYLPYYLTSNGYILGNKCIQIGENEYKINSYELTKSKIKELQKQNTNKLMYFSYDYSAESKIPMIRILCHRNRVITVEDVCGKVDGECFVPMTKIS